MLPAVRRRPKRAPGRLVARALCVILALCGLVPAGALSLLRTAWARNLATRETQALVAKMGIDARYGIEVGFFPLRLTVTDLRVASVDGGPPALTAPRVTVKPRIFGLLAGKLVIDQIEVERPDVRVVIADGRIQNLGIDLPKSDDDAGKKEKAKKGRPPFSVISASEADVDVTVNGVRGHAREIDVDVATDEDEHGAAAFEIAVRLAEAAARLPRTVAGEGGRPDAVAYDEDLLCDLDARVRVAEDRVLVRRLSGHGVADLDARDGTGGTCAVGPDDPRYVELGLGHLAVNLPKAGGSGIPDVAGHVKVRAPIPLVQRLPGAPSTSGWVEVDAELRYTPETPIPDLSGHVEVRNVRVDKFSFSKHIRADVEVRRSVVTLPLVQVDIAEGLAEIRDVEIRPLEKGIPLKAQLSAKDVNFSALMKDLGVAAHPHVAWDLNEVRAVDVHGTVDPLHIDGDLTAHTTNFAIYDQWVKVEPKARMTGVREGHLHGKLAIRPWALEFHNVTATTPKSKVENLLVSIGYNNAIRVESDKAKVDLSELSPLGTIPMSGVAEAKVRVYNDLSDPRLEGEVAIQDFVIGDLPFGNVTQGKVGLTGLVVSLADVKGQKGKSTFEMPTGRLDFGGSASFLMDAQIASKALDVRDFFSIFHLEEDPRFDELGGTLATRARMHLALGGPEDACGGGMLDVSANADARDLNVFGEKFDEGHADFEYHWADRLAGIEGADIDVRSISLTKAKKEGRQPLGTVLGSAHVKRGGELRGSLVLQGFPLGRANTLGKAAAMLEGTVSGVARVGGTVSAFDIDTDLSATPVRILGAPFGGSDVHLRMTQAAKPQKAIGKTGCGAPIYAAFDKQAYLADTSVQGAYEASGALFGGQIVLDGVKVTRQVAPVVTGKVRLARFDLGPIGKVLSVRGDEEEEEPGPALGGEITGDIVLERIATGDLAKARAQFRPETIRITRGGQKIELRTKETVIALENDAIALPRVTFDLATQNGFNGAFEAKGFVRDLTKGGRLDLDAELSPIDLGILVGVAPRVTRAAGTLSGAVRLKGALREPEFDGQLRIRGGELAVKGVPGAITGIEVDVVVDENEARVTRGVGHMLGGELAVTARMPVKGGTLGVAEANVVGRHLSVAPVDGLKATVDADLEISMNPQASTPAGRLPFVGGEVMITSLEYTRPITVDLTGLRGGARRTTVESYDPLLDVVTFGFDVRSKAPLRIRNNLVDAQLAIDPKGLRVSGTNQRIGLRGDVRSLPGGRFRVFANDFELQKVTLRFDDPTRIQPHVDILATTEYRRYANTMQSAGGSGGTSSLSSGGSGGNLWRIALHAYGDTEDLKVDMTSDPALSREDIFFLLTIGLTRAEVDQVKSGSVYASAAFEAIGTVSGADRAVKTALPVIDDFRFGSAYSPRTGRTEPQVTLGRRLTENVRANVSTGLTEDRQLRANVEWRLSRPLSVQASYDNISTVSSGSVGNFGLDFRWRLEFN